MREREKGKVRERESFLSAKLISVMNRKKFSTPTDRPMCVDGIQYCYVDKSLYRIKRSTLKITKTKSPNPERRYNIQNVYRHDGSY